MNADVDRHAHDHQRQGERPDSAGARSIPLLEWLVGGLGALLLVGTIGFLVWHGLGRDDTPPDVRLTVDRIEQLQNGYLVRFRAGNQGGSTAAQLVIEGELAGPEGPIETSEATLDYLPPRSDREGGLFFAHDPRGLDLRLRAEGYAKP
jgi:uncharacterized protein (TIGR02588 family)